MSESAPRVDLAEFEALTGVPRHRILRLVREGRLPPPEFKLTSRVYSWKRETVEKLIKDQSASKNDKTPVGRGRK